jgi:SAM-dependent methyltransferase
MRAETVRAYYHRILPFYDLELAGRGDTDFWAGEAAKPAGCRVLELGAGTGRATEALARAAARVVAFDVSPEMTAAARHKLQPFRNVSLLVGDMRDLRLKVRFDLVAAVDDPFVHLVKEEDRDRALETVACHLAPGGRFLLDAAWFPPARRRAAGDPGGLVLERCAQGGLQVRETWHCDPGERLCSASYEYLVKGQTVERASFPARLWSVEELRHRGRAAGLQVSRLWGDYDRRPWDRATSPRLIAEMRLL